MTIEWRDFPDRDDWSWPQHASTPAAAAADRGAGARSTFAVLRALRQAVRGGR